MSVCSNCGWTYSGRYCPRCGTESDYDDPSDKSEVILASEVTDEDREAEARRRLWTAMHVGRFDRAKCLSLARKLKVYDARDYFANFVEIACSGNEGDMCVFLDDSSGMDARIYGEAVLDFLVSHMTYGLYVSVRAYVRKARLPNSTAYENEIEKFSPERAHADTLEEEAEQYENKRRKRLCRILPPVIVIVVLLGAFLAGFFSSRCDSSDKIVGMSLSNYNVTVSVGETVSIAAEAEMSSGKEYDGEYVWIMNGDCMEIAYADNICIVYGVSPGAGSVIVSAGNYSAVCSVTVAASKTEDFGFAVSF